MLHPGLFIAITLYGPWYSAAALQGSLRDDPRFIYGLAAVWTVSSPRNLPAIRPPDRYIAPDLQWAQLSNLTTHINLRNLRPPGTRIRAIPYGYGFDLVSCPNYLFEVLGWTTVLALSWDPAGELALDTSKAGMSC